MAKNRIVRQQATVEDLENDIDPGGDVAIVLTDRSFSLGIG